MFKKPTNYDEACDIITPLRNFIEQCSNAYVNSESMLVSDSEYDRLFKLLVDIETQYPNLIVPGTPTKKVGSSVNSNTPFTVMKHSTKMYSLQNAFCKADIEAFHKTLLDLGIEPIYTIEYKYDGLAVDMVYENGILKHCLLRGNGLEGEDVLRNVNHANGIIDYIGVDLTNVEIRGEVVLTKDNFKVLNENGFTFVNCRNAVAGMIRRKTPNIVLNEMLTFMPYDMGVMKYGQLQFLRLLKSIGFNVNNHFPGITTVDQIETIYEHVAKERDSLKFDIDGLVIKLDSVADRVKAGFTSKDPKWAIAYKFKACDATTKLLAVKYDVGITGVLTPVALVEPVEIGGVTVSKCTLHNFDEITRLGISIGSTVVMERRGDVIPKIVLNLPSTDTLIPIVPPTNCPQCGCETIMDGKFLYCSRTSSCDGSVVNKLVRFTSPDVMGITGLSYAKLVDLYDQGIVLKHHDIYKLSVETLMACKYENGEMSKDYAIKLLAIINASRNVTLETFINSLSIPYVGAGTSKRLAAHFDNVAMFLNATLYELLTIPDIGEITATSIYNYITDLENINDINELASNLIITNDKPIVTGAKLIGKRFCITGTFNTSRDEIQKFIETNGGTVVKSVSKDLTYLVVGDNPGPTKVLAADKHKILKVNDAFVYGLI